MAGILGMLVLMAGLAQTGWDEEFLPRFHFPLVTVAIGIPPLVLGGFALLRGERASPVPFLARHAGTVSGVFLLAAISAHALTEGVVSEERFDMTWSLATCKRGAKDRTGVRLEFADHPGWTTDIDSRELGDHLVQRGDRKVAVTFRVVRDFGRLRLFKAIEVADRRDWSCNDHGGWSGSTGWQYAPVATETAVGTPPLR